MKKIIIPDLEKCLHVKFKHKPLLIGGLAMEYYGLRGAGKDVDFILQNSDHTKLKEILHKQGMIYLKGHHKSGYKKIPEFIDIYGDHGLLIYKFEIWDCILKFNYEYLSLGAIEENSCKIASLEKLLFMKCLAMDKPKYLLDMKLLAKKIIDNQYKNLG